jgi:hypothetical protein
MAKSIAETEPQFTPNTIVFRGTLEALRRELESKKTKWEVADDMFLELEKTINNALRERDRDEEIEFTENEWKQLITRENLPPVDVLTRKIEKMRKVTEEAKIEQGALLEDIKDEWKKLVKKAGTAIGITPEKLDAFRQKAEKIKNLSGPIAWTAGVTMSIGLFFKILGLRFKNWVSGLTGKKWKYDKEIELAEIEKAWIEDPVAAAKTYTGETLAQVKEKVEKKEGTKERDEWVTEKSDGWMLCKAVIWSTLLWGFMSKIPESLRSKIGPISGKNFLTKCAQNRALRMFGVPGFLLSGVAILSIFIEKPEIQEKLWPIPEGWDAQKNYFEHAIELCDSLGDNMRGVLRNIFVGTWSVLNGSTLDAYLDAHEKEVPEGMMTLEQKLSPLMEEIKDLRYDFEKWSDQIGPLLVAWAISVPAIRQLEWAAGTSSIKMAGLILWLVGKNFLATLFLIWWVQNLAVFAGHTILVPESNDEFESYLKDICDNPEVKKELTEKWISEDSINYVSESSTTVAGLLVDTEKRTEEITKAKKTVWEKLETIGKDLVAPEREKVIQDTTIRWFAWCLKWLKTNLKNPTDQEKKLTEKIEEYLKKCQSGYRMSPDDIGILVGLTTNTRIRIHSQKKDVIRWSILEGGMVVDSDFLCAGPLADINTQYHISRKLPINRDGGLWMVTSGFAEWFAWRLRDEAIEFREAMEKNSPKEGASAIEKWINRGGTMFYMAGKWVLWDGVAMSMTIPFVFGKNALDRIQGKITTQELVVETVDGLTPMIVLGSATKLITGGRFGILGAVLESPQYLYGWKQVQLGNYIFREFQNGKQKWHSFIDMWKNEKIIKTSYLMEGKYRLKSWKLLPLSIQGDMNAMRKHYQALADLEIIRRHVRLAKVAEKKWNTTLAESHLEKVRHEQSRLSKLRRWVFEGTATLSTHDWTWISKGIHPIVEIKTDSVENAEKSVIAQKNRLTDSLKEINKRLSSPQTSKLLRSKRLRGISIIGLIAAPLISSAVAESQNKQSASPDWYEWIDPGEYEWFLPESEKIDNASHEMKPIFDKMDEIWTIINPWDDLGVTAMLDSDIAWYRTATEENIRTTVGRFRENYAKAYETIKWFVREKKTLLLQYFHDNPEKAKKELPIGDHFGIGFNGTDIILSSTSREKILSNYFGLYDRVHTYKEDFKDGEITKEEQIRQIGVNFLPWVGSTIDTKQAWVDFRRGHIRSWLVNAGMATVGWIADALFVSTIVTWFIWLWGSTVLKAWLTTLKGTKIVKNALMIDTLGEATQQTVDPVKIIIIKDKKEVI